MKLFDKIFWTSDWNLLSLTLLFGKGVLNLPHFNLGGGGGVMAVMFEKFSGCATRLHNEPTQYYDDSKGF
jgi:hypothetical protein